MTKKKVIIFTSWPLTNHSVKMLLNTKTNDKIELWSCDNATHSDDRIKNNWNKSFFGLLKLLYLIFKVRNNSDIKINIHHEFNVYNGIYGLFIFPLYFILNRNLILTLHAYIPQNQINTNFLNRFNIRAPVFLSKIVFYSFYFLIFKYSKKVILHSNDQFGDANRDFKRFSSKFVVLLPGVEHAVQNIKDRKYYKLDTIYDFLSFGYISPRKGFQNILEAFKILKDENINFSYLICGFVQEKNISYYKFICEFIAKYDLNVRIIPGVDDVYIDSIFSQSRFSIFLYEDILGTSGPFNFALANNSTVICRNKGTFAEMNPNSSLFINKLDPLTISSVFKSALNMKDFHITQTIYSNWDNYVKRTFE